MSIPADSKCNPGPKPCAGASVQWRHVGWMHELDNTDGIPGNTPLRVFSEGKKSPFGVPGKDHSKSYKVASRPIYVKGAK